MNMPEIIEAIRHASFLRGVDGSILDQLASVSMPVQFSQNEVVFREGDIAESVYLITNGRISIEVCAPAKGCRRILSLESGALVGWSPLLQQARFTATARAIQKTAALQLNGKTILALCESDPRFGFVMMQRAALALSKRLSAARLQLLDLYSEQTASI